MSLLAATLLATSQAVAPSCSWDRPGHNRFTGDVAAAVLHYADIPAPVAKRLQQRIRSRDFDDLAEIRRDHIVGRYDYEPELRDMHFGAGRICRSTSRANWSAETIERGMVYCEGPFCVIVPTVCGNLSRVARRASEPSAASDVAGARVTMAPASTPAALAEPQTSFAQAAAPSSDASSAAWAPGVNQAPPVVDRVWTVLPAPGSPPADWPADAAIGIDDGFLPPRLPPLPPVPEPGTGWLVLLGGAGLAAAVRRRRHLPDRPGLTDASAQSNG